MSSTPHRWKYRIRHILEGITACQAYVSGMTEEQFGEDRRTLHAVAWELMMIGEAAVSVHRAGDWSAFRPKDAFLRKTCKPKTRTCPLRRRLPRRRLRM